MNLKVSLGKDKQNKEVVVDLAEQQIHCIILAGETCSGKTIFDHSLYVQLIKQNFVKDLGFVFFDMTAVEFATWKSPFLYKPVITDPAKALNQFENLAKESILRAKGKVNSQKAIIIHIEEMDMLNVSEKRFVEALIKITEHKDKNNMYVVFSSSRVGQETFNPTIIKCTDLKVVFKVSDKEASLYLLGESLAEKFTTPGQRVLVFGNRKIICKPFTPVEIKPFEYFFFTNLVNK